MCVLYTTHNTMSRPDTLAKWQSRLSSTCNHCRDKRLGHECHLATFCEVVANWRSSSASSRWIGCQARLGNRGWVVSCRCMNCRLAVLGSLRLLAALREICIPLH